MNESLLPDFHGVEERLIGLHGAELVIHRVTGYVGYLIGYLISWALTIVTVALPLAVIGLLAWWLVQVVR